MRAVVHSRYGPPSVLRVEEIEQPVPRDDELLVRVHATTVTRSDCGFRKPEPWFVRLFSGVVRPRHPVLGTEFAGEVEAVGAAVTEFAPGERVFGVNADRFGANAAFVCVRERAPIAPMPTALSFDEAAAVCDGAIIALSCLRKAGLASGQRILIYGASGSIGTAAVQLAKQIGAHVTAVCNTANVETVSSLGADEVVDYTREDFTAGDDTYDAVFDSVGKTSFRRCRRLLRRGGVYVETDLGFMWHVAPLALLTALTSRAGAKRVRLPIPRYTKDNVRFVKQLIEAGEYRAVIDRRYQLEQAVEATEYVETEQKTGNVVLTLE